MDMSDIEFVNLSDPDKRISREEALEQLRHYLGPIAKRAKDEGDDTTLHLLVAAEKAMEGNRPHLAILLNLVVQAEVGMRKVPEMNYQFEQAECFRFCPRVYG